MRNDKFGCVTKIKIEDLRMESAHLNVTSIISTSTGYSSPEIELQKLTHDI
jgi:hypothetical protein